jgi:hypothetical protein
VLRWRKQYSLMRLKYASAEESCGLLQQNNTLLGQREAQLALDAAQAAQRLQALEAELRGLQEVKMAAQTDVSKYQACDRGRALTRCLRPCLTLGVLALCRRRWAPLAPRSLCCVTSCSWRACAATQRRIARGSLRRALLQHRLSWKQRCCGLRS